jgi:hypothetical protein
VEVDVEVELEVRRVMDGAQKRVVAAAEVAGARCSAQEGIRSERRGERAGAAAALCARTST